MLVAPFGLLISVVVSNANCSAQHGGVIAVHDIEQAPVEALQLLWVEGDQGEYFARVVGQLCGAKVEVVQRAELGFALLPQ